MDVRAICFVYTRVARNCGNVKCVPLWTPGSGFFHEFKLISVHSRDESSRQASITVQDLKEQFLLFRIRSVKDERAFAELVNKYASGIYRMVRFKLPSAEDADDAYNTVLMRAWSYMTDSQVQNVGGLLHTIARTVIAEYYRTRGTRPQTVSIDTPGESPVDVEDQQSTRAIGTSAEIALVRDSIAKLNDKYQEVLHLKLFQDLSIREIANHLQVTEGAARMQLHRAMKALREQIDSHTV